MLYYVLCYVLCKHFIYKIETQFTITNITMTIIISTQHTQYQSHRPIIE